MHNTGLATAILNREEIRLTITSLGCERICWCPFMSPGLRPGQTRPKAGPNGRDLERRGRRSPRVPPKGVLHSQSDVQADPQRIEEPMGGPRADRAKQA
jgi:hypothetical protein